MNDFLQPVGDRVRRLAALMCLPAALVAAAMTSLVVVCMVNRGRFDHDGKLLWVAALVLGLISVALGWISVRLWTGKSANGVTILPVWFIELFGVLMLACSVWSALAFDLEWGMWLAGSVALAMLFIRGNVRRRQHWRDSQRSNARATPHELKN